MSTDAARPLTPYLADLRKQFQFSRFHWRLLVLIGIAHLFSGICTILPAFVIVPIAKEWSLSPIQIGVMGSFDALGGVLGALLSGQLADRFGRRSLTSALAGLFVGMTAASAFAPNFVTLVALRFLVGFGFFGYIAVSHTLLFELAHARDRGKISNIVGMFRSVGISIGAAVGLLIIPRWGWRVAVFSCVPGVLYALVLARRLVESPRFLENRGRWPEAVAIVQKIEEEWELAPSLMGLKAPETKKATVFDLWARERAGRTFSLWMIFTAMLYTWTAMTLWLPFLIIASGHTVAESFRYSTFMTLAQIPALLVALPLMDLLGRRVTIVGALGACALSCGGLALGIGSLKVVLVWGAILYMFVAVLFAAAQSYLSECYPTYLRATGAGWSVSIGRVAAMAAAYFIGYLIKAFPGRPEIVFTHIALILALAVATTLAFGQNTTGRALEDAAGANRQ